jgi:oligopeptide/dipeptide ABC transporter ATP-binding protein
MGQGYCGMPKNQGAMHDQPISTEHLSITDLEIGNKRGDAIVTDISFDVLPVRLLGIGGETGSGKSIVLKSMLTLLPDGLIVVKGELFLNCERVALGGKQHRKLLGDTLGFVPQDPLSSLNPVRTVYSQAKELVRKGPASAHSQISEAMNKAGLEEPETVIFKYPHELSGGLRQRVLIGLALIKKPKYLFCDEGTTALDVIIQQSVMQTLRHAVDTLGVGLVFVSHDIALIGAFSDSIVVMYGGHAVEIGQARDVLLRPRHPYTRALIDSEPKMEVGLIPAPIPGNVPSPGHRPKGCIFAPRCRNKQSKCVSQAPPLTVDGERRYACWFPVE